ncbi:MAG: isocitrate/isopropylmalate family dehydrogenase, partial [Dehalococcoidia bacterium]|nr:isocitrate/isopropylmalate family dehydrogenase [Dehalococcoidia bacterium]
MKFELAVLPGDGIGPEVIAEAVKVLDAVGKRYGHTFKYHYDLIGGAAIDKYGVALTDECLAMCK